MKLKLTLSILSIFAACTTFHAAAADNDVLESRSVTVDTYNTEDYDIDSYYEFINPDIQMTLTSKEEVPAMSESEIEQKITTIKEDFNRSLTEQIKTSAENNLNNYLQADNNQKSITAADDRDKYYNELRKGNFIESILDIDEEMTDSQIYKVGVKHANTARSAALKRYPNDIMLADGFRHFTWNYLAARDVGAKATRTATINHEWGILLITPSTKYFQERYEYYKSKNHKSPGNAALIDTTAYLPTLKRNVVLLSENNYSFFKGFFKKSNIMDLHNNCYGRAYASSNKADGFDKVYSIARNKKQIILSEASVTDGNYQYVWKNKWYTY